jgi:hypothetical protein
MGLRSYGFSQEGTEEAEGEKFTADYTDGRGFWEERSITIRSKSLSRIKISSAKIQRRTKLNTPS